MLTEGREISPMDLDLEARLAVSQDERRALLERSLASENRNEKLSAENTQLSRKIVELDSALQEIAREYQVLQVIFSNLAHHRSIFLVVSDANDEIESTSMVK